MAKKIEAAHLPNIRKATPKVPVIGVFATSDPRIDKDSRIRCQNIVKMTADTIGGTVVMPDKTPVPVVYSTPVIYEAPVVYYAPVYYLGGAALAIAGCVPQRVCAAPSTVVCIGGPHGNYAYSRCGSCGSRRDRP